MQDEPNDTTEIKEVQEPESDKPIDTVTATKKKWPSFSKRTWIIVGVLVVAIVSAGSWLVFGRSKPAPPVKQTSKKAAAVKPKELPDITFFDTAKPIAPINFITDYKIFGEQDCDPPGYTTGCEPTITASMFTYNQVGVTKDGSRIITAAYGSGLDTGDFTVLDNGNGNYTILALMSSAMGISETTSDTHADSIKRLKAGLDPKVIVDTTSKLAGTDFPAEIEVASQKLKTESYNRGYFILGGLNTIRGPFYGELKYGAPVKLGEKDGKTFYKVQITDNSTYSVNEFYATINAVYAMRYSPGGEVASNKNKVTYAWKTGEQNNSSYYSAGAGCGSAGGYVAAKGVTAQLLIDAGTTAGGQKLYQLPVTHPLVTELFEKDYNKGEMSDDPALKNLTLQQVTDKHGYFVVQNGLGEYVVFLRDDLFIRGGCAKPVVYLYPTQNTKVNVKVGADVVVSEPLYPKDGWKNVLARPNGQLTYQGSTYGSLFWEGYGQGPYPEITSGTVVPTSQAAVTLRSQLAAQGLRGREIDEFMEFWLPHIPNKPYVRISWLTTAQLNQLAPLTISPKPQTVIRTFLDFEGLDRPATIPEQKFSAPKRSGFTAVEWGGLLRGGIKH